MFLDVHCVLPNPARDVPSYGCNRDEADHADWVQQGPRLKLRSHDREGEECHDPSEQSHDRVLLEQREGAGERNLTKTNQNRIREQDAPGDDECRVQQADDPTCKICIDRKRNQHNGEQYEGQYHFPCHGFALVLPGIE